MKLTEILTILENRLYNLVENRKAAVVSGNLDTVNKFDDDITSTSVSIEQIRKTLAAIDSPNKTLVV